MLRASKKDQEFFNSFILATEDICEIARMQEGLVSNVGSINEDIKAFEEMEHRGDRTVHEMLDRLNHSFITPLDREDIYRIVKELDNITDSIEATVHRLKMYHIKSVEEDAKKLVYLITKCTLSLKEVMVELKKMKGKNRIKEKISQVNVIEYEGDLIFRNAIENLFMSGKDALEVMKWKEIYEHLENTLDACEDVANIIEGVVMKHA